MRELITTVCRGQAIQLLWQPEVEEIEAQMEQGFVPIEMAEGTRSFVDFRQLDHHNEYVHLPSACVTAMKFWGDLAGQKPAKLMVNHADSDCVIAGMTVLGLQPRELHERFNLEVGLVDSEPVDLDYSKLEFGGPIRLWRESMQSVKNSGWCWLYGLQLWMDLLERPEAYREQLDALDAMEEERARMAIEDRKRATVGPSGRVILVSPARVRGYELHFVRQPEHDAHTTEGWKYWCAIAYREMSENVLISCPNPRVAEAAFGPGGLRNVYGLLPSISGKNWGGREAAGGSPRGVPFPAERLPEVLEIVDAMVRTRKAQV